MKSQSISISGRSFYKFRALMDASLNKAVEKMLKAEVNADDEDPDDKEQPPDSGAAESPQA